LLCAYLEPGEALRYGLHLAPRVAGLAARFARRACPLPLRGLLASALRVDVDGVAGAALGALSRHAVSDPAPIHVGQLPEPAPSPPTGRVLSPLLPEQPHRGGGDRRSGAGRRDAGRVR